MQCPRVDLDITRIKRQVNIKSLLRKYRQLPGVVSVRADVDKRPNEIKHR